MSAVWYRLVLKIWKFAEIPFFCPLIGPRMATILLNPGEATLLLFENLNHTGIVAFSVLAIYDAIKAFAVLG